MDAKSEQSKLFLQSNRRINLAGGQEEQGLSGRSKAGSG